MAASHAVASPGQSFLFDERDFLRSMNKLGRAYRNQAMELISICRVFSICRAAEQIHRQDAKLTEVLRACDDALAPATEAGEKRSLISGQRIERAIRKLHDYEEIFHPRDQSSTYSVRNRMIRAMNKDQEESGGGGPPRLKSLFFKTPRTRAEDAQSRVVKFHLLTSITDTQPTLVPQVLADGSNLREILWNFSRYPSASGKRVTLAENPHFYRHHLPITLPNASLDNFTTDPTEHFLDADDIYVLTNKPGRVYLESKKNSRAFDNVWTANEIYIFKDVHGKLDGESIVFQGSFYKWCRVDPQREVWKPVPNWREAIFHVLHSQDKIRIKISTGPVPG